MNAAQKDTTTMNAYIIQTAAPRSDRWTDLGRSKTLGAAVKRALRAQTDGSVVARVLLTREQLAAAIASGEAYETVYGEIYDRAQTMRLDVV
jgi:hypothetical protein